MRMISHIEKHYASSHIFGRLVMDFMEFKPVLFHGESYRILRDLLSAWDYPPGVSYFSTSLLYFPFFRSPLLQITIFKRTYFLSNPRFWNYFQVVLTIICNIFSKGFWGKIEQIISWTCPTNYEQDCKCQYMHNSAVFVHCKNLWPASMFEVPNKVACKISCRGLQNYFYFCPY